MKATWNLLKQTASEWSEDKASMLAAALAYYTIFAIAPLLVLVISVAGLVFNEGQAQQALLEQIRQTVGQNAAGIVQTMISSQGGQGSSILATIIGFATLALGATGVFAQLQSALNQIWDVEPKPDEGVLHMVKIRATALGLVLVIAFLLLVSLVLSSLLSAFGGFLSNNLPGGAALWQLVNFALSLFVITLLFALIFKYLPDVKIAWGDVWIGAFVTALLFGVGRFLIGLYIGNSSTASTYGAAGSLIVLLLWIYYSAQILLFGAEFTQVYGRRFGSGIEPDEHAVRPSEA